MQPLVGVAPGVVGVAPCGGRGPGGNGVGSPLLLFRGGLEATGHSPAASYSVLLFVSPETFCTQSKVNYLISFNLSWLGWCCFLPMEWLFPFATSNPNYPTNPDQTFLFYQTFPEAPTSYPAASWNSAFATLLSHYNSCLYSLLHSHFLSCINVISVCVLSSLLDLNFPEGRNHIGFIFMYW